MSGIPGFTGEARMMRSAIRLGEDSARKMVDQVPNLDRTATMLTLIVTAIALDETDLSEEEFTELCGFVFRAVREPAMRQVVEGS